MLRKCNAIVTGANIRLQNENLVLQFRNTDVMLSLLREVGLLVRVVDARQKHAIFAANATNSRLYQRGRCPRDECPHPRR